MTILVNQDLCKGCGACAAACLDGAIEINNGKATIVNDLCRGCRSCIRVCPTGALQVSEQDAVVPIRPEVVEVYPSGQNLTIPQKQVALGGMALSLVGRYVLPRLVDFVFNSLERRYLSPAGQQKTSSLYSANRNQACRRRRRRCSGKNARWVESG